MAKKKSGGMTAAQKIGIGITATAAAAAAAGAYFLYGAKDAAKNRKKVKSWMLKAKGEILEALEKGGEITEAEYRAIVEGATGAYGAVQKATKGEMEEFKKEMADHWNKLQKSGVLKKVGGAVKKAAKKAAHPTAKAAPKKAPKKAVPKKASAKKVTKK